MPPWLANLRFGSHPIHPNHPTSSTIFKKVLIRACRCAFVPGDVVLVKMGLSDGAFVEPLSSLCEIEACSIHLLDYLCHEGGS